MTPFLPLALAFVAACEAGHAEPAAQAPPPTPVAVVPVEVKPVTPYDELSGRVEAIHRVDLRPRVSGYVTAVRYREGSEVAAGTVLFTVDARPYQAVYARAQAELARAMARVELTRIDTARTEKLVAATAVPRSELDTQKSVNAQAEAEVQAARAALELARLDVEFTQVRAPFAGRTGRAMVNVGDYVAPTAQLTSMVSVDPVYVYFTGDEQTYLSYPEKAPVQVGLADEQGFPHTGAIDFLDNHLDAQAGTILVRAIVPNPDKHLVPGLFARVKVAAASAAPAALVAERAILTDQDRKYVYVLDGDTVARRDIELGRSVDGMRVVKSGVKAGDRVIVDGLQKVFPGAKAAPKVAALP